MCLLKTLIKYLAEGIAGSASSGSNHFKCLWIRPSQCSRVISSLQNWVSSGPFVERLSGVNSSPDVSVCCLGLFNSDFKEARCKALGQT